MSNKSKTETLRRKARRAALDKLAHRPINDSVKVLIIRGTAHMQVK